VDEARQKMLWAALLPEFGPADLGRAVGAAGAGEPLLNHIPEFLIHDAELWHLLLDALGAITNSRKPLTG
jgi:hypothetical protein